PHDPPSPTRSTRSTRACDAPSGSPEGTGGVDSRNASAGRIVLSRIAHAVCNRRHVLHVRRQAPVAGAIGTSRLTAGTSAARERHSRAVVVHRRWRAIEAASPAHTTAVPSGTVGVPGVPHWRLARLDAPPGERSGGSPQLRRADHASHGKEDREKDYGPQTCRPQVHHP